MSEQAVGISMVLRSSSMPVPNTADLLGCALNVATDFLGLELDADSPIAVTPSEFLLGIKKARAAATRAEERDDLDGVSRLIQSWADGHPSARISVGWEDTIA